MIEIPERSQATAEEQEQFLLDASVSIARIRDEVKSCTNALYDGHRTKMNGETDLIGAPVETALRSLSVCWELLHQVQWDLHRLSLRIQKENDG